MALRRICRFPRNVDPFIIANKACLYRTLSGTYPNNFYSPTSLVNTSTYPKPKFQRCYCSKVPKNEQNQHSQQSKDGHTQPSKTWTYILGRFSDRLDKYLEKLSKTSPRFKSVVDVVRVIRCVKFVAQDTKTYGSVALDFWTGRDLETFSRKELEVYYQMPKDIVKLMPLLMIASIPIIGNFLFILGYLFPRQFLTHQFWTDEQKKKFFQLSHKKKLAEYKHILTYMDKQVHKHMTGKGRNKMLNILKKVESGSEPSIEELFEVKDYFTSFPLSVDSLPTPYFRHLVKSCDMSTRRFPLLMYGVFYFKQRRTPFQEDGYLLLHTDQVISKEGLDTLTDEEICKACLRRGLNPYGLAKDDWMNYLQKWISISMQLDGEKVYQSKPFDQMWVELFNQLGESNFNVIINLSPKQEILQFVTGCLAINFSNVERVACLKNCL